jgi:hypothetical protein
MKKCILIFDKGEQVGFEKIDSIAPENDSIEVVKAFINLEYIDVLYVRDMDYGIVIPKHIADKIRGTTNGTEE